MEWYRAYHGMPHDLKLKVVAKRSSQPMAHVVAVWVCLLDAASRHASRGTVEVDAEEIAVMQDLETEGVKAILEAFYSKGMLSEQNRLTAWDRRQYENSTERSRKHREKKKQDATPCNAAQQDGTPGNAKKQKNPPDRENRLQNTDSEVQKETDKKTDKDFRASAEKREREREKQRIGGKPTDQTQRKNQSQTQSQSETQIQTQMLDIWNELVQSKLTREQNAILTPQRKQSLGKRWSEDFQQDMRAWRYYCEVIAASDFCMGRIAGKHWTIDLSWAIASSDHVAKVLEGGFSGSSHPPKPPACAVPALQSASDEVIQSFQQKYGKACCRSWMANISVIDRQPRADGAAVRLRCPSGFVREWIAQHYFADLTRWWREATAAHENPVTVVELITEVQS